MEKKFYPKPKTQTAKRSLPPRKRLSESEGEGSCVVCAHAVEIYAVGQCDHYICFKCSTKIRLLCEENLCPVCRKELSKVIFTRKKESFQRLNTLKLIKDNDYDVGIYFADLAIIKDYRRILEHRCPVCPNRPPDRTFDLTKAHLRKDHTLFYCDICLEHNRTFTSECKVYNRKDLATHKRIGDPDDKSHRGHPLCEYCDVRFLDEDKLFHHLRTTHFYCHLCDNGETNEFYGSYPDLRLHFKEEHFLCEEGDCINEEFTSVFGTEIDYKAHVASVHRENRSKQQQKKDRQLNLGFQYARREPPPSRGRGGSSRIFDRQRPSHNRHNHVDNSNAFERESDLARAIAMSKEEKKKFDRKTVKNVDEEPAQSSAAPKAVPVPLVENNPTNFTHDDFPNLKTSLEKSLPEDTSKSDPPMTNSSSGNNLLLWSKDPKYVTSKFQSNEDFPSLPSQKPGPSSSWGKTVKSAKATKKSSEARPSSSKSAASVKTSTKNKKSSKGFNGTDEDFPKLDSKSEVRVGRGSSKHFEGFETYAEGATPNVAVVTAEFKEQNEGKSSLKKQSAPFKVVNDDFPTLASNSSSVSAPPGFGSVAPNPFLHGKASFAANNKKASSRPVSSTAVKPPPGFGPSSKTEQKQKSSQDITNSVASLGLDDFPTFVYPAQITPEFMMTDLDVTNAAHSSNEQNHSIVKTNSSNSSKKKSKGFTSKNRESDFPALAGNRHTPDQRKPTAQVSQQQSKSSKREPNASTNLNLANIFDFPAL